MTEEIVTCPGCGNEIGREYVIDGVVFLDCGGVIVHRLEANCKQCGRDIFWVVPDVRLERLIKKVLENREKRD
ncbi:MAG: hypothetical protein LLG42_06070 [Chloroflexi bacterium]|nr:hypothetical protein [Chloroflexota bacterium]